MSFHVKLFAIWDHFRAHARREVKLNEVRARGFRVPGQCGFAAGRVQGLPAFPTSSAYFMYLFSLGCLCCWLFPLPPSGASLRPQDPCSGVAAPSPPALLLSGSRPPEQPPTQLLAVFATTLSTGSEPPMAGAAPSCLQHRGGGAHKEISVE